MLYLLENVKDGVVLASYNFTSRDDTDDVVESLSSQPFPDVTAVSVEDV